MVLQCAGHCLLALMLLVPTHLVAMSTAPCAAEEDARLNLSLYKEVAHNWARIEDRRQVAILRRWVEQERRSALTPEERAEEDQARELAARLSRKGGYKFGGRGRGGRRY
ncbi:hypothetical protein BD779DRAFT_1477298 [Infundibulicybe gibba]|nr:hypothetical protein BD779DRAFT_1477298 [Infundibulicybe gibba]